MDEDSLPLRLISDPKLQLGSGYAGSKAMSGEVAR
jgi:hypothetical protein